MKLSARIQNKLIEYYPDHLEWAFEEMTVGQLLEVLNDMDE